MVKFNYFNGRPNKVKERFETFLIDHYSGDICNKNFWHVRKNTCTGVAHPSNTLQILWDMFLLPSLYILEKEMYM